MKGIGSQCDNYVTNHCHHLHCLLPPQFVPPVKKCIVTYTFVPSLYK